MANPASRVWILPRCCLYLVGDRTEAVIERKIEVVATIGSLLAVYTVVKLGKGLIRIDGEKFVLIRSDFSRLL
jgi:hypothetical protein